jgi:glycosyltransferase involved in cell wall biosynthesis
MIILKIGYFITHFPYKEQFVNYKYINNYVCGGGEIAAYKLAINMARRGHDVNIFTTAIDSKDYIEEYDCLRIYRYGSNFNIGNSHISFKLIYKPVMFDLDVIHAHHTTAPGVIAALNYCKRKSKRLIVTHHGFERYDGNGSLFRRFFVYLNAKYLVDIFFDKADIVISPSKGFIDESIHLKKYENKLKIIPNGINENDFVITDSKQDCRKKLGLPANTKIILFMGSLVPQKGPDILLKAIPLVKKIINNVYVIFGGQGEMLKKLVDIANQLNICNNVNFVGYVTDNLKKYYYKASDIFVLPSFTEAFPLVLLEASAAGLPLVVSDLTTFHDIITNGANGLITKRGDEKALADNILKLLNDEPLCRLMGNNAQYILKKYDWDSVALLTEDIYYTVYGG